MPELPEVETTLRGIAPHVLGKTVRTVIVRQPRLRWRVPAALTRELPGQAIRRVERRGKYLLLGADRGTAILHLGMSGSLRVADAAEPPGKSDHVDIVFAGGHCLRLRDPRRFGALLWTHAPLTHPLLAHLGPEPLGAEFDGGYLFRRTRRRHRAIRDFLLDGRMVAGIGNIYANEALFAAGVRPTRAAGRLTHAECDRLVKVIRTTLKRAIRAGGTTLRDFRGAHDRPGYFQQRLKVYGRAGAPCLTCQTPVRLRRLGQRSAFFCPRCQH
ncbi:MAG: DNA-formamidopyrimidine glycosylase [Candidatus Muproteobacteria bacterium RBG_16_64_11]|uniref:Formamidopyrimidine-DNA glycosylase n=1 Tax=Candidatus Muproteobacteria bacterium RBG_16_64_11 TaxID=1817758 RepID=A0A1F6TA75_9PROT|nr:MAG: DNA-formamidopyrimidine glycosylase [Candidatus Muproteobacteria bacterium RBG_16_64_11]